jgi:predicted deacylase
MKIGGVEVMPGERRTIELPVARMPNAADLAMAVHVVRGKRDGPRLFVSAAIHGDEINGVEIVSRLLRMRALDRLRGTLIAVPVVNGFGFSGYSRYLPDRRDLNRSFPGRERGSLAARLAHLFMEQIVSNATHGIDLHTGAIHRTNLPQLRLTDGDAASLEMAKHFGAFVVLKSKLRDGSLRAAAAERKLPMVMYEGGEALRFDEWAITAGLRGVLATMHHLEMLPSRRTQPRAPRPVVIASNSVWIRAPEGGILRTRASLGKRVAKNDALGVIGDAFGREPIVVRAPGAAIVIGRTQLPVVNEGDALFHLLPLSKRPPPEALEPIEAFQAEIAALTAPED